MLNQLKDLEEFDKEHHVLAVYDNEPEDYNLTFRFPEQMMYSVDQLKEMNVFGML